MRPIVVVTPNPAVDVTYRVRSYRQGETVRVDEIIREPGGKGVNVARVLAQAGRSVHAVVPLGGDSGRWFASELHRRGIDATVVDVRGATRSTVAVVDGDAHPTLFAESGAAISPRELADLGRAVDDALRDASLLIVAGSLPPGITSAALGTWISSARRHGVDTLIDASGPVLVAAAAAGATTVKANASELREATSRETVDAGIHRLLELGAARVVVSLGGDGLVAATRQERIAVPAAQRVDGNPTGAGDAATAGLAMALVERQPLEVCARQAAAMGTASVASPQAGEVHLALYAAFLDRYAEPQVTTTGAAQ